MHGGGGVRGAEGGRSAGGECIAPSLIGAVAGAGIGVSASFTIARALRGAVPAGAGVAAAAFVALATVAAYTVASIATTGTAGGARSRGGEWAKGGRVVGDESVGPTAGGGRGGAGGPAKAGGRGVADAPTEAAGKAELAARASLAGMCAGVNFGVWAWGLPGLYYVAGTGTGKLLSTAIGAAVGGISGLAAFPRISRRARYQALLAWTGWAMPMMWPVTATGLALFLINLLPALLTRGPGAVRLDPSTGTIETAGGITGITGFIGGFNLGHFSFITPRARPTPFGEPGLSAHETGHTLNVAAFGWIFHLLNAIDENLPPLARGHRAYAELAAESHHPRPGRPHIRLWS